ncbi:MAG: YfcE family phosphodiesterase [Thermoplasmata archaeon]
MSKIIIISDIHGNFDSLKTLDSENYDFLVFAGDAVDYGPEPEKVVDFLIKNAYKSVMGNHDAANAFDIDCKCSEKYHEISVITRKYFKKNLNKRHLNFLGLLPMFNNFEIDGIKFTMVHASLMDYLYDYVLPETDDKTLLYKFKNTESDFVIFGHTHLPMIKKINKTTFINPGSLGQPRDGDIRASFAILDTKTGEVKIIRKEYDVKETIRKINEQGLENNIKDSLSKILLTGGKF